MAKLIFATERQLSRPAPPPSIRPARAEKKRAIPRRERVLHGFGFPKPTSRHLSDPHKYFAQFTPPPPPPGRSPMRRPQPRVLICISARQPAGRPSRTMVGKAKPRAAGSESVSQKDLRLYVWPQFRGFPTGHIWREVMWMDVAGGGHVRSISHGRPSS